MKKFLFKSKFVIMAIRDKIDLDYKNSLKLKDKIKISTYRLILSGIKELDIINLSLIHI